MGLHKTIQTNYGIDLDYHHISSVQWEKSSPGRTLVRISSFVSKSVRDSGANPVRISTINLDSVFLGDGEVDLGLASLYDRVVLLEEYSGATPE